MKVVLFCGGLGTRIREYGESVPKPMIPIGNQPILRHLMNSYADFGHNDFLLCLGYKANTIKEYFINHRPFDDVDCVIDNGEVRQLNEEKPRERVTMIDTGIWRNVGSRLWSVREHLEDEEMFFANYSDGLSDVNLDEMVEKFKASGKVACLLAVRPIATYHIIDFDDLNQVTRFQTTQNSETWINGGFFIFRREIFDYMREGEDLPHEPIQRLMAEGQLLAYKHDGFWRPMDTLHDRQALEQLMEKGSMPWRRHAENGQPEPV